MRSAPTRPWRVAMAMRAAGASSPLLQQVVDGSGRSAARDPSPDAETTLNQVYDKVIRETPDDRLPAVEASENAWVAYRDTFDRFALSMDRPDAAKVVRDDLAQHRADELLAGVGR